MATRTEVAMVLSRLAAGFTEVVISPAMVQAWCEDFEDIPGEFLLQAALEARRAATQHFPRIGAIRERAETLWRRAIEAERSKDLLIEGRVPDRNDPATIEGRAQLRELMRGIGKSMPEAKPEEPPA